MAQPASAQVQLGDANMTMAGDLGFGYSGATSDPGGSSHGMNLIGTGYLRGYYHDPQFISFHVQPSYGRTQDDSALQSVFDTTSVAANASFFGAGNFPGTIVYTKTYNSAGQFGFVGVNGLVTKSDSQAFAINWNERIADWPTLSASFSDTSGNTSLIGTSEVEHSTTRSYSLHSGYRLKGFDLGADFLHMDANTDASLLAGFLESTQSSSTSYGASVAHSLPLHGYFAARYMRTSYNDTVASLDSKYYGTADNVNSTLGFMVGVPVTITANYTDDLFATLQQYLINTGNYVPVTTYAPKSSQLALNASSQYVWHQINFTGYVNHIEQNIGDYNYASTQGGGTVGYNLARFIKGLYVSAGMVNTANQDGNQRVALIGNVNYGRNMGRWGFNGNFSYDQNTNTLGIFYTTSNMNYSANVGRRFTDHLRWSASFSGGHSVIEQQSGTQSHSEGFFTNVMWRQFSASGSYTQSYGTSILTPSGVLPVPLPGQPSYNLTNYNARSLGGGVAFNPMPKLTINASYARSNSYLENYAVSSTNFSEQIYSRVSYRFRKMNFNAGYNRICQVLSASSNGPVTINTYYIGVTRWFDFF